MGWGGVGGMGRGTHGVGALLGFWALFAELGLATFIT